MNSAYKDAEARVKRVQMFLDNNELEDAAANMKKLAETVARFYYEKWNAAEKYMATIKSKKPNEKEKMDLHSYIVALRLKVNPFSDGYKRNLLILLTLAQTYGNEGSHYGNELDRTEIEYVLLFYKKYIRKHLQDDCERKTISDSMYEDVTRSFANKRVLIYSLVAEQYATARLDADSVPVFCNTDNQDWWEQFLVTVDKDGQASFMAANNLYLSVNLNEQKYFPPIRGIAPESLSWEKFKIYKIGSSYAIKAVCNQKWVTTRIDWDNNPMLASCTKPDFWEMFDIKIV